MENPVVVFFVILLVVYSVTLHELGHAFVATWCGDPTPGKHGRLTFNPLVQLDPFASVILPIVTYLVAGFPFGWAFCPIDPSKFKRPLRDRALTAVAGPTMNFIMVAVLLGIFWLLWFLASRGIGPNPWDSYNGPILGIAALYNLILGVFNLIPLPGLDGYDLCRPALPLGLRQPLDDFRKMGFMPLMVAVFVGSALLRHILPTLLEFFSYLLPPKPEQQLAFWKQGFGLLGIL